MQSADAAILNLVGRYARVRGHGTLPSLIAFGRVIKEAGVQVSLSQVMDASRSLEHVEVGCRDDFRAVLRSNLVSQREQMPLFDRLFDCFWQERSLEESCAESDSLESPQEGEDGAQPGGGEESLEEVLVAISNQDAKSDQEEEPFQVPTYSPNEAVSKKDFSEMGVEESRAISRAILRIANKIATQVSRRKKRANKGDEIDPRWTMRRNIKYGGEIIELVARKRRIKKTRVILLCDVSGSMDCYSRFLIQFMYGLQNELWGVETFVFSTYLSRITHLIRSKDIGSALERISSTVLGWSGGTNIGRSLAAFNREFAANMVSRRTVVVIISDGWDRGDVGLLEREMRSLKGRCRKLIWLNPLLASENYEPLCKGMQAALPYLDLFLSVHNLSSLIALGRTLQRLVA